MEEKKFFIPEMDQSEIVKWYQNISPIVKDSGKSRYLRRLSDEELSKVAYTWLKKESDYEDAVDYSNLEVLAELQMLHQCGWYGFFKPSVAEVIRQIPKEFLPQTVAFEIIHQKDLNDYKKEVNAGFHVSTVRLYKARS
jgi:hypothetical protein